MHIYIKNTKIMLTETYDTLHKHPSVNGILLRKLKA